MGLRVLRHWICNCLYHQHGHVSLSLQPDKVVSGILE